MLKKSNPPPCLRSELLPAHLTPQQKQTPTVQNYRTIRIDMRHGRWARRLCNAICLTS